MTDREKDQKEERLEEKTFLVPFPLGGIKDNFSINTNKPSKEQLTPKHLLYIHKEKFQKQQNIIKRLSIKDVMITGFFLIMELY